MCVRAERRAEFNIQALQDSQDYDTWLPLSLAQGQEPLGHLRRLLRVNKRDDAVGIITPHKSIYQLLP